MTTRIKPQDMPRCRSDLAIDSNLTLLLGDIEIVSHKNLQQNLDHGIRIDLARSCGRQVSARRRNAHD